MNNRELTENREECSNRIAAVAGLLDRCVAELERLEGIPGVTVDQLNAISASKGFAQRARGVIENFRELRRV